MYDYCYCLGGLYFYTVGTNVFLESCIFVVDIMKMCMWIFDGGGINFDRITVFITYNFQWIILKPCIFVVDILEMCIWVFDGARLNFDRITAF